MLISTSWRSCTSCGSTGTGWLGLARACRGAPAAWDRPAAAPGSRSRRRRVLRSSASIGAEVASAGRLLLARSGPRGRVARIARSSSGRPRPTGRGARRDREPEPAERVAPCREAVVQREGQDRPARRCRPAPSSRRSPSGSRRWPARRPSPCRRWSGCRRSALATSKFSWLKSARAFCELDRLGLLRVGLGRGGDLELGRGRSCRPAPGPARCSGSRSSASTSSRTPVMPRQVGLGDDRVRSPFSSLPAATIEPSACLRQRRRRRWPASDLRLERHPVDGRRLLLLPTRRSWPASVASYAFSSASSFAVVSASLLLLARRASGRAPSRRRPARPWPRRSPASRSFSSLGRVGGDLGLALGRAPSASCGGRRRSSRCRRRHGVDLARRSPAG